MPTKLKRGRDEERRSAGDKHLHTRVVRRYSLGDGCFMITCSAAVVSFSSSAPAEQDTSGQLLSLEEADSHRKPTHPAVSQTVQ